MNTKTNTRRAYFFQVHDKITCCRLPGARTIEAESLEDAVRQLPPNEVPWEAHVERGNQLTRISNQNIFDACKAAGKYSWTQVYPRHGK